MTPTQLQILTYLAAHPQSSRRAIAEGTGLPAKSVGNALTVLYVNGLVARGRSMLETATRWHWAITARGAEALAAASMVEAS